MQDDDLHRLRSQGLSGLRAVVRIALLAVMAAAACGDDAQMTVEVDAGPVSFVDGGACAAELAVFCEGMPCPTFAQSVAEVMQLAKGSCFVAESGSCGSLRYTFHSNGFTGFQAWFDAAGMLVAAHTFSDIPDLCNHTARQEDFGAQPVCTRMPTAMYCP